MEIKDLLNQTISCPKCKGIESKDCDVCVGSGVVIDSFITDMMIKNGIRGKAMVDFAESVYKHYEDKLVDAYNRGVNNANSKTDDQQQ